MPASPHSYASVPSLWTPPPPLLPQQSWLYNYPKESEALLYRIADISVDYLVGQVRAGASLLQVFESWAGELSPAQFKQFSLPLLQHIASV